MFPYGIRKTCFATENSIFILLYLGFYFLNQETQQMFEFHTGILKLSFWNVSNSYLIN